LGETVTEEGLKPHLFSSRENRYRSAWLASKRHYFALFAKEMRAALDRVAPHVRLGICSCFPNWDHDGISSFELAKLLAGNTRPLLRLCGAPYWAPKRMLGNHRLQDTIEVTRMERSFCEEKGGVEILGEGFECETVEGIEAGESVDVAFDFSAVELTDDPDDGTSWGTIRFILYKGDRYHLTIRTDEGEDIFVDTHDVWEDLDEVGIKIVPSALRITKLAK
jgi:hypothetical protein